LLVDLSNGSRGTDLTAEHAGVLAISHPRYQDGSPQALEPRLEVCRVQRVVRTDLHALGAADAALEELAFFHGAGRTDDLVRVGLVRPVGDAGGRNGHGTCGRRRHDGAALQVRLA